MRKINIRHILILTVLSYLFLMLGNGILSLTSPDEVFYVQTAKEMAQRNSWATQYLFGQPQFEKPIFTYWLLRIGFYMFNGVNSFSARFFPALFGMLGVIMVYWLGVWGFKDTKKAFLAALILASGVLYIGLSRTVFTDMIFSILVAFSCACVYRGAYAEQKAGRWRLLFFASAGLAVLTKGFLGIIFPLLTAVIFLAMVKRLRFLFCRGSLLGVVIFFLAWVPWYWLMTHRYGHDFTHEFYYNDHWRRVLEAEHKENDNWFFYPLNIVACMFPWTLFAAAGLCALPKVLRQRKDEFILFLAIWIAVVFVVCQAAHSKLVSYVFPLFPALALLTANYVADAVAGLRGKRVVPVLLLMTGIVLVVFGVATGIATTFFHKEIARFVSAKAPLYGGAVVSIVLGGVIGACAYARRWTWGFLLLACTVPLLLCIIPFIRNDLEPYLSSKPACDFLLSNYKVDSVVLASKPYVRDVRFYSDKEAAVVDIPGLQFFSPHPVPFLNSDEKVKAFLRTQPVTYGILKPSNLEDMQRIAADKDFEYRILFTAGSRSVVRFTTRKK